MKTLLPIVASIFALTSFCACGSDTTTSSSSDSTVIMTAPTLDAPVTAMDTSMNTNTPTDDAARSGQTGVASEIDERRAASAASSATSTSSSTTITNRNNPETDRNPLTNNPKAQTNAAPKMKHNSHDSVDSRFGLAPAK